MKFFIFLIGVMFHLVGAITIYTVATESSMGIFDKFGIGVGILGILTGHYIFLILLKINK